MENYKDKAWLEANYVDRRLSCRRCADLAGVTAMVIHHWLRVHEIPTRPVGSHMKGEANPRLGTCVPEATRRKIARSLTGHKRSRESVRKQAEKMRGPLSASYGKPRRHGKTLWIKPSGRDAFAVRSRWEAIFADWLESQGKTWAYEPETFILDDGSAYTPDFLCEGVYYEIKGYMTTADQSKIEGFRRTFPGLELRVIGREEMSAIGLGPGRVIRLRSLAIVDGRKRDCPTCKTTFLPPEKDTVYCSRRCAAAKPKKPKAEIRCTVCKKVILVPPSKAATQKTCSKACGYVLSGKKTAGPKHWTARKRRGWL
jgi:hypothetical protein